MSRKDKHEWAEAYMAEYQEFSTQGTLKIAKPEKGAKILDKTTSADYKVTNSVFDKRKIRWCVWGNQQEEGVHCNSGDLYAPVMKASEVWLAFNLAASENLNKYKTDTKQAFLIGEMGKEII